MRLLLDEHVPAAVASGLRAAGVTASTLAEWADGACLQRSDGEILDAAAVDGWSLVTYDRRTIPPLLKAWSEAGRPHGGVVLVDERTIRPDDVGTLVRALRLLEAEQGRIDWRDRVVYLQRTQRS